MSSNARTRFDVSASPTRQQLDELDALMQRMLALPVHPESPTLTEAVSPRSTPPARETAVPKAVFDFGSYTTDEGATATAVAPAPTASRATIDPLFDFAALAEPPPPPATQPFLDESSPAVAALENYPSLAERAPGFVVYPLVQVDRLFEIATLAFGPVGAFLRGHAGRNLLGTLGVVLLVVAGVWCILDGIGWTW